MNSLLKTSRYFNLRRLLPSKHFITTTKTKYQHPLPDFTGEMQHDDIYIFVDNTDFFLQGTYAVGRLERLGTFNDKRGYCYDNLKIEYKKLKELIKAKHNLVKTPLLVGSPQKNNEFLKSVGNSGFNFIEDNDGHEKTTIVHEIDKIILDQSKKPGIIAIVAGDRDYCPILPTAKRLNWKVETWFWNAGMKYYYVQIYELSDY
jgi:hypothetical protein